MTPTKVMLPLPTSHSTIFAQRPATFEQWQVALKGVKLLYLKRLYKKCAARCTQLLLEAGCNIHPVHRTYLQFYSALCYEILARATHHLSNNKLPLLYQAQEAYTAASESLPIPPTEEEEEEEEEQGDMMFGENYKTTTLDCPSNDLDALPTPSTVTSDTPRSSMLSPTLTDASTPLTSIADEIYESDKRVVGVDTASFAQGYEVRHGHAVLDDSSLESDLRPAPLFIRKTKVVHFDDSPQKATPTSSETHTNGYPSAHSHRPLTLLKPLVLPHTTFSSSASMASFLLSRSLARYNKELASLRPHISSHINSVNSLIDTAETLQDCRRRSKADPSLRNFKRLASFWSFKPTHTAMQSTERQERIERLRANNWKLGHGAGTPGFKGTQYYDELCGKALKELEELRG